MGKYKSDWSDGSDGTDNGLEPYPYDPGGEGMYQSPTQVGGGYNIGNDPFAGSTAGADSGGFNIPTNLITTGLGLWNDNRNINATQDDTNQYMDRGIPYSQANRNAASDRLNGLTSGSINASSDPAFLANLGLRDANLSRQLNARGMSLSGNEIGALSQQDLAAYSDWRQRELEREMTRSGASFNPAPMAAAGLTMAQVLASMRNNRNGALGNSLGNNTKPNTDGGLDIASILRSGNRQPTNSSNPSGSNAPRGTNTNFGGLRDWEGAYQPWQGDGLDPNGMGAWQPVDTSGPDWTPPMPDINIDYGDYGAGDMDLSGYDFSGMWDW